MNLESCFSPLHIFNKGLNEFIDVPDRTCLACRSRRQYEWELRLKREASLHRYCAFFTLSYSDDFIPFNYIDGNQLYSSDGVLTCDFSNHLEDPITYLEDNSDTCVTTSLASYISKRNVIPVPSKTDVQKFLKRFRRYVDRWFGKVDDIYGKQVRYFICSEFGPLAKRPHYHGLFFFDASCIAENFNSLLVKSWSLGNINWSYACEQKLSYCAKYITCSDNLPFIYQAKEIRPFYLSSRRPAIGVLPDEDQRTKILFFTQALTESLWTGKEQRDVPLFSVVENRLFPKCKGFNSLSHSNRVALYGIASNPIICEWIESHKSDVFSEAPKSVSQWPVPFELRDVDILNYYSLSKHILRMCNKFCCSVEDYVTNIEIYYHKKAQNLLKQFYEFQQSYGHTFESLGNPRSDLIFLYPDFLRELPTFQADLRPFECDFIASFNALSVLYTVDGLRRTILPASVVRRRDLLNDIYSSSKTSRKVNDHIQYKHKHHLYINLNSNIYA